jgi:O-phosphoseryl-tRNA(Cys) synthetase
MAKAIERSLKALRGKDERGPMTVWRGQLLVHDDISELVSDGSPIPEGAGAIKAELLLEEAKDGMGLFGPGAFDQIWVKDGNIIGAPPSLTKEMRSSGALRTGKSYLRAFSNYAGWKVERSLSRGSTSKSFEMVRRLEDMNMHLTSKAQNYVLSRSRKVDVKGPVFLRFRFLLGSRPQSG